MGSQVRVTTVLRGSALNAGLFLVIFRYWLNGRWKKKLQSRDDEVYNVYLSQKYRTENYLKQG